MSSPVEIPEENTTVEEEVTETSIVPVIAGTAIGLGLALIGTTLVSMWKDRNDSPDDDETDVIVIDEDTTSPEDN